MWRMPLPSSASYKGMIAPPGYPNTRSTPSARKHCKKISAPLSIHDRFLLGRLGLGGLLARIFLQPRHHAAQVRSDRFDLMTLLSLAQGGEILAPSLVLVDPFARKRAGLNVGKNLLHRSASFVTHNFRSTGQVAILSCVRDRVAHPVQAALVNEIDNQLHFMNALKVRDLRLITGLDQRFKTFLHQRGQSAAEHGLLTEQIALGFFFKCGLQNSGPSRADAVGIRER